MAAKRKSVSTEKKQPLSKAQEEVYQVERVLDKRVTADGEIEYKIRWKGFNSSYDTWEPSANCDCPGLIAEFEKKHSVVNPKTTTKRAVKTIPIITKPIEKPKNKRSSVITKTTMETRRSAGVRKPEKDSSTASKSKSVDSLNKSSAAPKNGTVAVPADKSAPTDPADHTCKCGCQNWRNELMARITTLETRIAALKRNKTRIAEGSADIATNGDVDENVYIPL